jgi:Gpi18-like mannosyltransferase
LIVFAKAVPVVFDSLTASLLFLALSWSSVTAAVIGAAAYVVQPVGVYDAAVWGQTDAVYGFFVLAAVYAASASRWAAALFLFALACASKGNAIGVAPFFVVLAVHNRDRLPQMVAGGAAAVVVTVLPFVLAGTAWSLRVLLDPRVPAPDNAPNLWLLLKTSVLSRETQIGFTTPLPLRGLSYAIWIALTAEPMRRLCRRGGFEALSLAAAVCAYAFFLFAIGVRERYGFPVAALLVPIIFISWEGVLLYLCVSAVLLANMLGDTLWEPIGWLARYVPSPPRLAVANLALFAWLGWFAIRAASLPETART